MVSAFVDNSNCDFWSEVRRKTGNGHTYPNVVDNSEGASAIGEMCSQK